MADHGIRLGHATVVTPDLDRLRRFYEHTLGLEVVAEDVPPVERFTRLAALSDGRRVVLLALEQPDVEVAGSADEHRAIHHVAFVAADAEAFDAALSRLVETGSSDGVCTPIGPTLSASFTDPDGRDLRLQRLNPEWDPASIGASRSLLDLIGA